MGAGSTARYSRRLVLSQRVCDEVEHGVREGGDFEFRVRKPLDAANKDLLRFAAARSSLIGSRPCFCL